MQRSFLSNRFFRISHWVLIAVLLAAIFGTLCRADSAQRLSIAGRTQTGTAGLLSDLIRETGNS